MQVELLKCAGRWHCVFIVYTGSILCLKMQLGIIHEAGREWGIWGYLEDRWVYILHFIVYIHRHFTNKKYLKKFLYDFPALFFYNPILYKTYKNLNTGELSSLCYQIPNKNNYNNKLFGLWFQRIYCTVIWPIQPDRTSWCWKCVKKVVYFTWEKN